MRSAAPIAVVTVPATAEHVHLLRTVAGSVAARAGRTIDAIDDLRLAVDEAAGQVLGAGPARTLTMSIASEGDGLIVELASDATPAAWPPPGPASVLALDILSALAGDVVFAVEDGAPTVRFSSPGDGSR
ncbi:MAG: hypothetical protein WD739_06240 [Actinomycetota bacterium]